MKWIIPYKLFEVLNRYGYEGDIIDIDKNELSECINCLNKLFYPLFGNDEVISPNVYKNGYSENAYSAVFSNCIIKYDNEYDKILSIMSDILFNTTSKCYSMYLLNRDGTYEVNGYNIVFTNNENFRTRLDKISVKVKVPETKNKIIIILLSYYIAYLEEVIGNEITYNKITYAINAPILKNLIINYCEYLLSINRTGKDLFAVSIDKKDVYKVLLDTIIHDGNQHKILNGIKVQFPTLFKELSSIGNIAKLDTSTEMGEMGF